MNHNLQWASLLPLSRLQSCTWSWEYASVCNGGALRRSPYTFDMFVTAVNTRWYVEWRNRVAARSHPVHVHDVCLTQVCQTSVGLPWLLARARAAFASLSLPCEDHTLWTITVALFLSAHAINHLFILKVIIHQSCEALMPVAAT